MTDTTSTSTPGAPDTGVPTTYNVIAVSFDADVNAYAALTKLKELDAQDQIEMHEALVARRGADGTIAVKDRVDSDELVGTAGGGLTGLLVGILGGPLGVLLGARPASSPARSSTSTGPRRSTPPWVSSRSRSRPSGPPFSPS